MKKIGTIMMVALFAATAAQASLQVLYSADGETTGGGAIDQWTGDGSQNGTYDPAANAVLDMSVSTSSKIGTHAYAWHGSSDGDHIEIADSTDLGSEFTLGTYFLAGWGNPYRRLMSSYGNDGVYNDSVMFLTIGPNNTGVYSLAFHLESSNIQYAQNYDDGLWHHVAVSYDNGVGTMYLDGVQVGSNGSMSTDTTLDQNILLGSQEGGGNNFQNGLMDDVFIWDKALNATQIADIAANGVESVIPEPATMGLVGLFGGALMVLRRKLMI